ncbi:hypothetical protein K6U06_19820 [Acidiferrimicrobium sp. IK]|uniref:hypothetical protein n=1 Tax=Acidiferrimicrobium sp. IK TaxID=2871700 RepID=UPI0021CB1EA3|nr:hypothetical protein [Acidiferrimicrobium sp. IK]MCU4186623.1 hypothetical protein [Acidiferrimicrobium sp. IK]
MLNSFWVTKLLHSYPKSVEESAGWPGEPSETFSKWEARSAAQRTKTFDTVGVSIAELERFDFTSECLHGSHGVQTIDGREVRQALRSALRTRTRQVTLLSHRLGPLWDPGPSDRGVDFNSAADYAEWKDSGR